MSKAETTYFKELTDHGDYICPECGVIILLADVNDKPRRFIDCPKCGVEIFLPRTLWEKNRKLRSKLFADRYGKQSWVEI